MSEWPWRAGWTLLWGGAEVPGRPVTPGTLPQGEMAKVAWSLQGEQEVLVELCMTPGV